MDFWAILFVVAIILIITLIILWVAELFAAPVPPVGPVCITDADCKNGDRCQNGQCKSPIGGTCTTLSDCVRGAIACQGGVCISEPRNGVGQPCPCQAGLLCQAGFCRAPIGATCLQSSDCASGSLCIMGVCTVGPTGPTGITGPTGMTGPTGPTACPIYPVYPSHKHRNKPKHRPSYIETTSSYEEEDVVYSAQPSQVSYPHQNIHRDVYSAQPSQVSYPHQNIHRDVYSAQPSHQQDVYHEQPSQVSYPHQNIHQDVYSPYTISSSEDDGPEHYYLGPCLTSHECREGYFCSPRTVYQGYKNGKLLPIISKQYLPGENAIDVVVHYDQLYILLEGGDILKVADHVPIRIESSLPLERLFSFTGHMYGLASGYLYVANDESLATTSWQWEVVPNFSGLTEVSFTLDNNYLWLETLTQGYLYDRQWQLVETIKSKRFQKRIYGPNRETWIDLYNNHAKTSHGERYDRLRTCSFQPSGQIFLPHNDDVFLIRFLPYRGEYVPFFVLERGCIPV